VQVDIDQRKLAQLGLSLDTVIDRLQQENVNVSGGRLEEGSQRYLVRTVNQFATVDEMRDMLLTTRGGVGGRRGAEAADAPRASRLQRRRQRAAALPQRGAAAAAWQACRYACATWPSVRQGYKEREAIIRLNGREAVELAIYKEGDANTVPWPTRWMRR
jgi:HAE1 family hydrophobic/amphiphilic exporter-1